jgi:hypothetical protein
MLSLHRPTSSFSSTTNSPWLSPTDSWLARSADCLKDNSSARTPQKTPYSFVKDACLRLRCLAIDVLFHAFSWRGPHTKHAFPYIVVTFLRGMFIYRRIFPCGGGVEYLHRSPASRRRRQKGKSQIRDSKIWSRVSRDSDPRMNALARASSNCKWQTNHLVIEDVI